MFCENALSRTEYELYNLFIMSQWCLTIKKIFKIQYFSTFSFNLPADFGLSNICEGDNLLKTQCGSPEYAAPELFRRGCRYGTEVDLWSLWVNWNFYIFHRASVFERVSIFPNLLHSAIQIYVDLNNPFLSLGVAKLIDWNTLNAVHTHNFSVWLILHNTYAKQIKRKSGIFYIYCYLYCYLYIMKVFYASSFILKHRDLLISKSLFKYHLFVFYRLSLYFFIVNSFSTKLKSSIKMSTSSFSFRGVIMYGIVVGQLPFR